MTIGLQLVRLNQLPSPVTPVHEIALALVTLSVAGELRAEPKALVTRTRNCAPLSPSVKTGVM